MNVHVSNLVSVKLEKYPILNLLLMKNALQSLLFCLCLLSLIIAIVCFLVCHLKTKLQLVQRHTSRLVRRRQNEIEPCLLSIMFELNKLPIKFSVSFKIAPIFLKLPAYMLMIFRPISNILFHYTRLLEH